MKAMNGTSQRSATPEPIAINSSADGTPKQIVVTGKRVVRDAALSRAIRAHRKASTAWNEVIERDHQVRADLESANQVACEAEKNVWKELERHPDVLLESGGKVFGSAELLDLASPGSVSVVTLADDGESDETNGAACQCGRDGESAPPVDITAELEPMVTTFAKLHADWKAKVAECDAAEQTRDSVDYAIHDLIGKAGSKQILFRGVAYDLDSHDLLEQMYGKIGESNGQASPPATDTARPSEEPEANPNSRVKPPFAPGAIVRDTELAAAFDAQVSTYEAVQTTRGAHEDAEAACGEAEEAVDRLLKRFSGCIVSYRGKAYEPSDARIGNDFPSGPPVVMIEA